VWGEHFDSPQEFARRERESLLGLERDREALCQLLRSRGFDAAGLVVAAAELTLDDINPNWNGGQHEVVLAVPPPMYDGANSEPVLAQLSSAAEAVVGSEHFVAVRIALRRGEAKEGWDWQVAQDILSAARDSSTATLPQLGS